MLNDMSWLKLSLRLYERTFRNRFLIRRIFSIRQKTKIISTTTTITRNKNRMILNISISNSRNRLILTILLSILIDIYFIKTYTFSLIVWKIWHHYVMRINFASLSRNIFVTQFWFDILWNCQIWKEKIAKRFIEQLIQNFNIEIQKTCFSNFISFIKKAILDIKCLRTTKFSILRLKQFQIRQNCRNKIRFQSNYYDLKQFWLRFST